MSTSQYRPADPDAPRWAHDTVDVLGVRVSMLDAERLCAFIEEAVRDRRRLTITFANPNYVMAARRNPGLREMINSFDLVLADGWGVVMATRVFGRPVPRRMANDDLTDEFFGLPARRGWRTFLFGNAPGVAESAAENLREWYPGLPIAGVQHGYWTVSDGRIEAADRDRLVKEINAARPDILHVGLGTPLQQAFVIDGRDDLDVPVVITCGAYLEHLSERREWYPPWVLRLRIGWLYRLSRDPRRLWYRYTIELGSYVLRVFAHRLRHGRQR